MKRILCALMCVVMLAAFFACNSSDNRSEYSLLKGYERAEDIPTFDFVSGEIQLPEEYNNYTSGISSFSFKLLGSMASNKDNVVVSSLSMVNALSILANGAYDNTKKEIRTTVSGVDMDLLNGANYYLNSRLTAFNGDSAKLTLADALWCDDSFDVKTAFLQNIVNYYNAEVMRVDLGASDTKDKVNGWISDTTGGKLTSTVDKISEETLMLMVSAIFMEDEWVTPYLSNQIKEGTFHADGADVKVDFMTSTENYISTDYAQGFVKSFKNLPLKFAAIMPAEDVTAEEFAQGLTAAKWQALLESQQATNFCTASMPSFEISYKNDVTSVFRALGINDAFNSAKADFSQMSNTGKPYVSGVVHDTFIQIGPAGAKAGAATVTDVKGNDVSSDIPSVTFDKPFVFVIYDNESGVPVFTGVVNNPAK